MAFDANVFGLANKPTVALQTPNEAMAQAAQVQGAINQNRLFQAQVARGQVVQQATGADGTFNPLLANQLMAQRPDAALAASQALDQTQGQAMSQQAQRLKQQQFVGQALGAVLDLPDAQLHDGVIQAVTRAQTAGLIDQQAGLKLMGNLSNDPAQLRSQLRQVQLGLQGPEGQQQQTFGAPGTMSDGQSVQPGVVASPARGGGFTPGGPATQVYPSRADLLTQQEQIDPATGRTIRTPLANQANQQGRPDLTGPAGTAPGQVPSSLLPRGYTGRYAPGGGAPAAPSGQPSASAAPAGAVVTGFAPGQVQEADAAVAHLTEARGAANTYATRMQPLMAAQTALRDAKTGAGSEKLNSIRQTLQSFTPGFIDGFRPLGGSAEQDAAFDEARKYLTNYAANTPGANRSDAGGQTAANANANVHISPLAAKYVVQAAIGMERMRQAQTLEFNASGQPGSAYDRFQSNLATNADPRAFIADQQTPDERKKLLDGMTAPQRANYLASVRLGMKHGLLNLGGGG